MSEPVASRDWFDDDSFWETFAPLFFTAVKDDATTEREVEALIRLAQLAPGEVVLDLPCGPARISVALARRGWKATGVDRTARYLEMARERALAAGVEVELMRSDMRHFRRPEAFDLAINFYTSFGYFEDPADDLAVLRNFHDNLRPGGRLLLDVLGKEILARTFQTRTWSRIPGGDGIALEEHELVDGMRYVDNRWTWIQGAERREFRFTLRLYAGTELARALAEAGFSRVELFGGLDGSPYDHAAKRLVALAWK